MVTEPQINLSWHSLSLDDNTYPVDSSLYIYFELYFSFFSFVFTFLPSAHDYILPVSLKQKEKLISKCNFLIHDIQWDIQCGKPRFFIFSN